MATLINGNGNAPVTAQQDADFFQGILGGSGVKMLAVGSQMAYTIEDANTITLADGECVDSEGRRIHIDFGYTDSFTIPTGTSGSTKYYIIGYLLSEDSDGNETAEMFVQTMSSATATIDEDSLRDGASSKYVSLYRVTQTSLTISSVEALFDVAEGLMDKTIETVTDYDTAISATKTGTVPDCTVIAEMASNFTDGCSTIAGAITTAGVTTASNASPSTMAANIATLASNKYSSGYSDGAESITLTVVSLGTATSSNLTFDCTGIDGYKSLTASNFALYVTGVSVSGGAVNANSAIYPLFGTISSSCSPALSYNASTGTLTVSGMSCSNTSYNTDITWYRYISASVTAKVYCYYLQQEG